MGVCFDNLDYRYRCIYLLSDDVSDFCLESLQSDCVYIVLIIDVAVYFLFFCV